MVGNGSADDSSDEDYADKSDAAGSKRGGRPRPQKRVRSLNLPSTLRFSLASTILSQASSVLIGLKREHLSISIASRMKMCGKSDGTFYETFGEIMEV
jgi:hypothetical protein